MNTAASKIQYKFILPYILFIQIACMTSFVSALDFLAPESRTAKITGFLDEGDDQSQKNLGIKLENLIVQTAEQNTGLRETQSDPFDTALLSLSALEKGLFTPDQAAKYVVPIIHYYLDPGSFDYYAAGLLVLHALHLRLPGVTAVMLEQAFREVEGVQHEGDHAKMILDYIEDDPPPPEQKEAVNAIIEKYIGPEFYARTPDVVSTYDAAIRDINTHFMQGRNVRARKFLLLLFETYPEKADEIIKKIWEGSNLPVAFIKKIIRRFHASITVESINHLFDTYFTHYPVKAAEIAVASLVYHVAGCQEMLPIWRERLADTTGRSRPLEERNYLLYVIDFAAAGAGVEGFTLAAAEQEVDSFFQSLGKTPDIDYAYTAAAEIIENKNPLIDARLVKKWMLHCIEGGRLDMAADLLRIALDEGVEGFTKADVETVLQESLSRKDPLSAAHLGISSLAALKKNPAIFCA